MINNKKRKIIKIFFSLMISNVFFYLLWSSIEQKEELAPSIEYVKVKVFAKVFTEIEKNKKVLLVHHQRHQKIEGLIESSELEADDSLIVKVLEEHAHHLLNEKTWIILPYLKNYSIAQKVRRNWHEIVY